jgi:hypothetical protein
MKKIIKLYFKFKQRRKMKLFSIFPGFSNLRQLEKRSYLTLEGIKNWDELSYRDMYWLNIEIV